MINNSILAGNGIFYPINPLFISSEGPQLTRVIIQYVLTGIIGMTFSASSIIFKMEKCSLLKETVIHFCPTSVVMYFCGFFCNWFEHTAIATLIWFAIFIVIYIIFWLAFKLYYKITIKKINKTL